MVFLLLLKEVRHSSRLCSTWIKPLSFRTSTRLTFDFFGGRKPNLCFCSVTVFGDLDGIMWNLVSPRGPGLAACGRPTPEAGLQGLPRRCQELFWGKFPALLLGVSAAWNTWLVKGNGFLGSKGTPKLGKTNRHAHQGSSIPASWALCFLGPARTIFSTGC